MMEELANRTNEKLRVKKPEFKVVEGGEAPSIEGKVTQETEVRTELEKERVKLKEITLPEQETAPVERKLPKGKNKLISTFEKLIPKAFRVEVVGAENLQKISSDENPVLVTTHITDSDMVIALAGVGKATDEGSRFGQTKLIQMAGNFENTFFRNVMRVTGRENWLPVSVYGSGEDRVSKFNPDDFKRINACLGQGYPVAIAESLDPNSDGWNLSKKIGNGAARLALSGNVILPIAVEINEPIPMKAEFIEQVAVLWKLIKRPKAKVIIGEPIRVEPDFEIANIDRTLDKREHHEKITHEELENFRVAKQELRETSLRIKMAIADLLPEERRGPWVQE